MLGLLRWFLSLFRRTTPPPPAPVCEPDTDVSPEPDFETLEGPIDDPVPVANGLRHDWRTASAAWLYPGDPDYWIASHRMMGWTEEKIANYLAQPDLEGTTHIIICPNTGRRPATYEEPFNALGSEANSRHARAVFEQVIAADFAPILWCMSQEFFIQNLSRNHGRLIDHLMETCALLSDLSQMAVPFREIGDIYGGSELPKRNDMFRAMRTGAPNLPLACHERAMEQIPVDDFAGVSGDVISLLQTGFGTPTGGQNRSVDRVEHGGHTYDGAAGFVEQSARRMADWQEKGRMERHSNAVGEHSLPQVYEGQTWGPTRTIIQAIARGHVLLDAGAAFDLSSGAIVDG